MTTTEETTTEESTPEETPQGYTGEQLQELLGLIDDSDSIELKATVPDSTLRSTLTALGIDPLDAQIRLVTFFDTPDLTLDTAGVVVRARRIQGKGDDSVIKLRPVVPSDLPAELRRSASFNVEVDALPGGFVCSASMKGTLRPTDVSALPAPASCPSASSSRRSSGRSSRPRAGGHRARRPVRPRADLRAEVPLQPGGSRRRLVAEVWLYPDGSRILELSTRCGTTEAFQVAAETRAFLHGRGDRPLRRAADEDPQGARVLLGRASKADELTIVPRWEWRTFGEGFGRPRRGSRRSTPGAVDDSDEIYVLSTRSDASVKMRDGLMDVKHLETVNDDGLEQWIAGAEGRVPARRRPTRPRFVAELGVEPGTLDRDAYTLDELLGEVEAAPASSGRSASTSSGSTTRSAAA